MGFNGGASRLWDDLRGIHKKWITLRGAEDTCLIKKKWEQEKWRGTGLKTYKAGWVVDTPLCLATVISGLGSRNAYLCWTYLFLMTLFFWMECMQISILSSVNCSWLFQGVGVAYCIPLCGLFYSTWMKCQWSDLKHQFNQVITLNSPLPVTIPPKSCLGIGHVV